MSIVKAHAFFKPKNIKGPSIILDSLLTPENIGSCIRLAGNINADKLIITGEYKDLSTKIKKIARNSLSHLEICFLSYEEVLKQYSTIIAIETTEEAQNIYDFQWPLQCAIVVGNEKFGIHTEFLNQIPQQVYIPVPGKVQSINVSHALSIALFEWYRVLSKS